MVPNKTKNSTFSEIVTFSQIVTLFLKTNCIRIIFVTAVQKMSRKLLGSPKIINQTFFSTKMRGNYYERQSPS